MERKLVLPGEQVAQGDMMLGEGVYREGDGIFASTVGLLDEKKGAIRIIPMTGKYFPKVGDFVVGLVVGGLFTNWDVDINSAYSGVLNAGDFFRRVDPRETDINTIMAPGTMIYAQVREITHSKKVYLTMEDRASRIIKGGRLMDVIPAKVPRVIGRNSSMLNMIRDGSGCKVIAGQNGRVWIDGEPWRIDMVERIIKMVEKEAHKAGLTDAVKERIAKEREEYESRT